MFELEPELAQRRAAPEASSSSNEAGAISRPVGLHDTASLLHLQRTALSGTIMCLVAGMVASADTVDYPSPETVAGFFTHADTWTLQLLVGALLILIAIGWVIRRD